MKTNNKNKQSLYYEAIRHTFSDAKNIHSPEIDGYNKSVFFTTIGQKNYVIKFNSLEMAEKNSIVSDLLSKNGITAPKPKVYNYNDLFFEVYPILQGETFYKKIQDGMPEKDIQETFIKITENLAKMSNINISDFKPIKHKKIHTIAGKSLSKSPYLLLLFRAGLILLNSGQKNLLHFDLNTKNIILSEKDHQIAFIDLDSVSLCNLHFVLAYIANKYEALGFNKKDLYKHYEKCSGKKLNKTKLMLEENLTLIGKKIVVKIKPKAR